MPGRIRVEPLGVAMPSATSRVLFSPDVQPLLGLFDLQHASPGFGYMLFASAFLAAVALAAGMARRDVLALRTRAARVKVALAVAAGALLAWVGAAIASTGDPAWWQPEGFYRIPLYLIALAYGPSVGCVAGVCYLAISWLVPGLGSTPPVLALELAVLGWLAIYPSPTRHRWAGPVHSVLAYVLAWLTAGLATVVAARESVSPALLAAQHAPVLIGVLVAAALLGLVAPPRYRKWFPESRIHDAGAADPP